MGKNELMQFLIQNGIIKTKSVMNAFLSVRREDFVLPQFRKQAYENIPLPIHANQTISQPQTVIDMTEALQVKKGQKILEIGTGSGYQAAILSEIVGEKGRVVTTERIEELFLFAKNNLKGRKNVFVINCDGSRGYEKEEPYDRIIVTASAPALPEPLVEQMKDGGKMVIPVGDEMFLVEKHEGKIEKKFLGYYAFVPLLGEYGHSQS